MKKLTVKEKKEITTKIKDNPYLGYKSISKKFNITVSQSRTIKNSIEKLLTTKTTKNLNQVRVKSNEKYNEFYGELMSELKRLRSEGFPISFLDIKTGAEIIKQKKTKIWAYKCYRLFY